MLGNYNTSPFDLSFEVLGIPVRVTGWFWLFSAIFGWSAIHQGVDFLLAWMLVCFISILVHELGHALTARSFGYRVWVTLYQLGGVAEYDRLVGHTLWRSLAISIAGPLAGFMLYGLIFFLKPVVLDAMLLNMPPRTSLLLGEIIRDLIWVNLWWGLLNLVPVLPLDGGQICRDICLLINRRQGLVWSLQVSVVVAFATAYFAYQYLGLYPAMLFALLGFEALSNMQNRQSPW